MGVHGESHKSRVLQELKAAGLKPRLEILSHGLSDEETALRIEAAVIDLLGLDNLTNLVRGWQSVQFGRKPSEELVPYYAAKPTDIKDAVILIRINQRYRHGMSSQELYEATRGIWKLSPHRAERATYAFALFEGIVREVYEIEQWHPAGTLEYETRELNLDETRR